MKNFPELVFHVESGDPSVGIMTEGFSAWENKGTTHCNLINIEPPTFEWLDNDYLDPVTRPDNAEIVEKFLVACANMYYDKLK